MKACTCGRLLDPAAKTCPNCGKPFKGPSNAPAALLTMAGFFPAAYAVLYYDANYSGRGFNQAPAWVPLVAVAGTIVTVVGLIWFIANRLRDS